MNKIVYMFDLALIKLNMILVKVMELSITFFILLAYF
jgi:hypothetical protein